MILSQDDNKDNGYFVVNCILIVLTFFASMVYESLNKHIYCEANDNAVVE